MPIRIECTTEGLEECFVEVSERWTRADFQALFQPDKFVGVWLRKARACNLALVSSDEPLTDVKQVFIDVDGATVLNDDLDMRLRTFPESALILAADQVASLGKMNARLSSGGTGRAEKQKLPQTMETILPA